MKCPKIRIFQSRSKNKLQQKINNYLFSLNKATKVEVDVKFQMNNGIVSFIGTIIHSR